MSAGFAAALALITSTSSDTPVGVAVTSRFTPGSTLAYLAVAPESDGTGSVPNGHDTDSESGPDDNVYSGPVPPPDNFSPRVIAFGATDPSGCTDSLATTHPWLDPAWQA